MRTKVVRIVCLAAAGAMLIGGSLTASTAATAATEAPSQAAINTHKPPRAPFVVDGVQYAPQEITKFNGRPLYFVVNPGKSPEMIGYTSKTAYEAEVAARQTAAGRAQPDGAGQWLDLYEADENRGDSARFNSAWGVNNLAGIGRGCGIFGCAGTWDNVASSVVWNGNVALYDGAGYTGSSISLPYGYYWANLSWYGWDNRVSSLDVWW